MQALPDDFGFAGPQTFGHKDHVPGIRGMLKHEDPRFSVLQSIDNRIGIDPRDRASIETTACGL